MEIDKSQTYNIRVKIDNDTIYRYIGKIIDNSDGFLKFIDDRGKQWIYSLSVVLSMESIDKKDGAGGYNANK